MRILPFCIVLKSTQSEFAQYLFHLLCLLQYYSSIIYTWEEGGNGVPNTSNRKLWHFPALAEISNSFHLRSYSRKKYFAECSLKTQRCQYISSGCVISFHIVNRNTYCLNFWITVTLRFSILLQLCLMEVILLDNLKKNPVVKVT